LLGYGLLQAVELLFAEIVGIGHGEVSVRVDEAGEKRGITEVNDFSAGGNACGGANAGDFAASDNNEARGNHGIALAIKETSRFQDVSFAGRLVILSISGRPGKKE
jgi:hypothetical protein